MAKIFPVIVKKTVVTGGGGPNASWTDNVDLSDPTITVVEPNPDTVQVSDPVLKEVVLNPDNLLELDSLPVLSSGISETVQMVDPTIIAITGGNETTQLPDIIAPTVTPVDAFTEADAMTTSGSNAWSETAQKSETQLATVAWTAMPRSGTPDSDAWGDSYVTYTAVTNGTNSSNFGSASSLLLNGSTAVGQKIVWIEFDLTRVVGYTQSASVPQSTLSFNYTNGNTGAVVSSIGYFTSSTRPFTESTITSANAPSTATTTLASPSLAVGTNLTLSQGFGTATTSAWIGKWVALKITGGTLQSSDITIFSRESGTPPSLTLYLSAT